MTLPVPFKLSDQNLLQIALQVAMDLASIQDICTEKGITVLYYQREIEPNPFYQKVLQQYRLEWNSVKNTPERVKWKAQALIEMGLAALGPRMLNPNEALPAVTETAKLVSRIAGVDSEKNSAGNSEKFTITINLGPDNTVTYEKTDTKTIDGPALPALSEGEGAGPALQALPQGAGDDTPVQPITGPARDSA